MAGSRRGQAIPTQLGLALFEQFVLPHLSIGSRGPTPKLGLFKIFNYVLHLLSIGCQWKELPIEKDGEGRPEIHYTRIYSAWRRWEADGCIDAIFASSVMQLHQDELLDTTVIHGDGTTTAAKKGGDNIGSYPCDTPAPAPKQPGPYAHSREALRRRQRIDPLLHHN